MNTNTQSTLHRILLGNAIFSGVSGAIFASFSSFMAKFLGVDAPLIIFALGVGLMIYGVYIYIMTRQESISRNFVLFAIIADSAWVAISIVLLVTNWVPFSLEGKWTIGILAAIVDTFAVLQVLQWRKI